MRSFVTTYVTFEFIIISSGLRWMYNINCDVRSVGFVGEEMRLQIKRTKMVVETLASRARVSVELIRVNG